MLLNNQPKKFLKNLIKSFPIEEVFDNENEILHELAELHGVSLEQIQREFKIGTEIEYEHTDNTIEAKKIALDHLKEFPDYYTRLIRMEFEAENNIN